MTQTTERVIPFGDIKREYALIKEEIQEAVHRVLEGGWFILGQHLEELESRFAEFLGKNCHAVGVASGTDALELALMAMGVEQGDYVITVPNTAFPTTAAITACGATPLFADIDPTSLVMDPEALEAAIQRYQPHFGSKLKAIIPVHLYGQSADMKRICDIAKKYNLRVVEDACQAHGAKFEGVSVGLWGDFGAFSFYPSKNLGAYGDAGLVVTKNLLDAEKLKLLRNYGQKKRYEHLERGINSRLDEIQAAILNVKLKYLPDWNRRRRELAYLYDTAISHPLVRKPHFFNSDLHVYHLYVIRCSQREALQEHLQKQGIQTALHYPHPLHLQPAYRNLGYRLGDFPHAEQAAKEILSLPIFPQLEENEIHHIAQMINSFSMRDLC